MEHYNLDTIIIDCEREVSPCGMYTICGKHLFWLHHWVNFFISDRFVFSLFISGGKTIYDIGPMKAPKYLWKAVCANGQSIVFVAENNVGEFSNTKVKQGTCLGKEMTKVNGVIRCDSLNKVRQIFNGFKFPDFNDKECSINNQGDFLEKYIKFQ